MGNFGSDFSKGFNPSFRQGIQSGSDLAKVRLQAKLKREEKIEDERRAEERLRNTD